MEENPNEFKIVQYYDHIDNLWNNKTPCSYRVLDSSNFYIDICGVLNFFLHIRLCKLIALKMHKDHAPWLYPQKFAVDLRLDLDWLISIATNDPMTTRR